jgi:uncharacterized MAPEG superfamily protein
MPIAYWCILVAALLPFGWVAYAKAGSGSNNHYPREDYDDLTPRKRRAYAAHQNAFEGFPFFAVAVLAALTMGAPAGALNVLAVLYVLLRVTHGLLYISDKSSLRSLAFTAALVVNVAIFALPAFR